MTEKRVYTDYTKTKNMTKEELKEHKKKLYKRFYERNKERIKEQNIKNFKYKYHNDNTFKNLCLLNTFKNRVDISDEEMKNLNYCYDKIRDYFKMKKIKEKPYFEEINNLIII
jgi:hypothetical protein